MPGYGKVVLAVFAAGMWISLSEFVRNQLLLASYWTDHYTAMGLVFPARPLNGMVWGLWSFVFAGLLYVLLQKFSAKQTLAIGWVAGFVLMWLVVGNLQVLPFGLLWYAVPLSVLEVAVAVLIIKKIT